MLNRNRELFEELRECPKLGKQGLDFTRSRKHVHSRGKLQVAAVSRVARRGTRDQQDRGNAALPGNQGADCPGTHSGVSRNYGEAHTAREPRSQARRRWLSRAGELRATKFNGGT